MKRIFLLFAIFAAFICVKAEDITSGGILYTIYHSISNNTMKTSLEVTAWSDKSKYSGTLTIPSTVTYNNKTYNVERIGQLAFNNCTSLTQVNLPSTIKSIGQYAFTGSGVTSIDIPASVNNIDSRAFEAAKKLQSVRFSANSQLTVLHDHVFMDCEALTSVDFGSNSKVTKIEASAFHHAGLTSVTLPASLEEIGDDAFSGCDNLTFVSLPSELMNIGNSAFYGCSELRVPTIPENVNYIGEKAFYACSKCAPEFKAVFVEVGKDAFKNCAYKTFETPAGLEAAEGAFACPNLTEVVLWSQRLASNGYIGSGGNDNTLAKVFGNNVQKLTITNSANPGSNWARGCTSLKTLVLINASTIGEAAFKDCVNLTGKIEVNNLTIGKEAFAGTAVTGLSITNDGSIGEQAFANCKSLKKVNLYNTAVKTNAFLNCTGMTDLTLITSAYYKSVQENAFMGCSGLTTTHLYSFYRSDVYLPRAFATCTGNLYVHSDTQQSYKSGASPLSGSFFKEVDFLDENKVVGENVLSDMPYLTQVNFTTTTTLKNPIAIDCPKLGYYYAVGNSKFKASWGCVFDNDFTTLYTAPLGSKILTIPSTVKTIDCMGILYASPHTVFDATSLNSVPELTNDTMLNATILVKPGMKSKFLEYGANHRFQTRFGTTFSVYESARYLEIAPDPVQDVNNDGKVNSTDVVNIYNYIIGAAK